MSNVTPKEIISTSQLLEFGPTWAGVEGERQYHYALQQEVNNKLALAARLSELERERDEALKRIKDIDAWFVGEFARIGVTCAPGTRPSASSLTNERGDRCLAGWETERKRAEAAESQVAVLRGAISKARDMIVELCEEEGNAQNLSTIFTTLGAALTPSPERVAKFEIKTDRIGENEWSFDLYLNGEFLMYNGACDSQEEADAAAVLLGTKLKNIGLQVIYPNYPKLNPDFTAPSPESTEEKK